MPTYDVFSEAADIVAAQTAARADALKRGTNLHGWSGSYAEVQTIEAVVARIEAETARARAFRATPRGRFLTAVEDLRDCGGYECEAYDLQGIYSRSLDDPRQPLNVGAVGAALAILDRDGLSQLSTCREARRALDELLIEAGGLRMAAE